MRRPAVFSAPVLLAGLVAYTAAALAVDARLDGPAARLGLGAATWLLLLCWWWRLPGAARRETAACVAVSGAAELVLTQAWGLYSYRLGPVPLYVFAGHGLVQLFSVEVASRPWIRARARRFAAVTLALATFWTLASLALRPAFGLSPDLHGALYLPVLAGLLLTSERRAAYAATFFFTSFIELVGTAAGDWHWAPQVPGLGLASADPPSAVAGGYCLFALVAHAVVARVPARADAAPADPLAR